MKLVKYIFTIPFDPKNKWKKALKSIDNSVKIKEDVFLLFLIVTFIPVLMTQVIHPYWYSLEVVFSQVLSIYIGAILKLILLFFGMSIFGSFLQINKISTFKLISVLLLALGLVSFIQSLLDNYFVSDDVLYGDYYYYIPWYYYVFKVGVSLAGAFILTVGFLECQETKFKSREIKKNYGYIILFFIIINAVNYLYSLIFSTFLYSLFYSF